MTMCEQLSDRMPAVARGAAEWTVEEHAHLAACADCQAEWQLVLTANGLGLDVAAALDAHHVTERVLGRLRVERRSRSRRIAWLVSGLAAAAALLLVVRSGREPRRPAVSPAFAGAEIPLPELDSLRTPELQAVLDGLDNPTASGAVQGVDTGELDDLDSHELQTVLDGMEG